MMRLGRALAAMAIFTGAAVLGMAGADTISGRIVGPGATPLANARVILTRLNFSDTTGADGRFEIKMPSSAVAPEAGSRAPGLSLRGDRIEFDLPQRQSVSLALFGLGGRREAVLFRGELPGGPQSLSLADARAGLAPGLHILALTSGHATRFLRVFADAGVLRESPAAADGDGQGPAASALAKAAAGPDTIQIIKTGWFTKKTAVATLATQDMGDLSLVRDYVSVGNVPQDKYDQQLIDAVSNNHLDTTLGLILKAMIVIESSFNAQAISMYDTQLPCGTHSYGLIQVTPGCERGYATLPAGTAVTATISGGLNGNAAVLAWNDPADKASGNTIVKENNIIIDLVTNPANPFWPTSAFNPAYSIDNGGKALYNVMDEMKRKFTNCTAGNYVSMALAGYNQGYLKLSLCTS
jgi:hypothetical protein